MSLVQDYAGEMFGQLSRSYTVRTVGGIGGLSTSNLLIHGSSDLHDNVPDRSLSLVA